MLLAAVIVHVARVLITAFLALTIVILLDINPLDLSFSEKNVFQSSPNILFKFLPLYAGVLGHL
jgi:hypothetical protein